MVTTNKGILVTRIEDYDPASNLAWVHTIKNETIKTAMDNLVGDTAEIIRMIEEENNETLKKHPDWRKVVKKGYYFQEEEELEELDPKAFWDIWTGRYLRYSLVFPAAAIVAIIACYLLLY